MAFTIPHSEMSGYPKSRWTYGDFVGVRKLKVAWEDRFNLALELEQYPNNIWPYEDGSDDAIIFDTHSEPLRDSRIQQAGTALAPLASYQHAILTSRYSNRGPKYVNGKYIEEFFTPWNEHHQVDWTNLAWDGPLGTSLLPNEAPSWTYYGIEYVIKFSQLATPPPETLAYVGYINSNAVITYTFNRIFGVGTLLYAGCTLRRKLSLGGVQKWDVSYRFLYKHAGWNKAWRLRRAPNSGHDNCFLKNPGGQQLQLFPSMVF